MVAESIDVKRKLLQHPAAQIAGDVLLLILAVIGLMWIEPFLREQFSQGAFNVHSKLLVPGFILIIGAFGGRVAHHFRLPHLTGFLIMGVLIGPESPVQSMALIQTDDFDHIRFVQDLAIGLIALMAGVEIRMAWLRARLRGILNVVLWQTMCVPVVIMITVMMLWSSMPFAQIAEAAKMPAWIIALLMGIIALANSPMVVISCIKEAKAQGPLTETAMGVSVFKDVVVILGFTIALAVAVSMDASSGESGIAKAGFGALLKILISIVVGFGIGYVLRIFSQRTDFRLTWLLVGVATIVAVLEPIMGIKPLFCLLAAGFACENFGQRSEYGVHHLESALARVAAPVFILFFVSAGLKLHMHALYDAWLIIVGLVSIRAIAIFTSVGFAAKASKLEPSVRRNLWAAMIPQAGVSISLAAIISTQFPDWGSSLQTVVIAGIAIHELVGPVIFTIALKKAGEAKKT